LTSPVLFPPTFVRFFAKEKAPFRWQPYRDPNDIAVTDEVISKLFPPKSVIAAVAKISQRKNCFPGVGRHALCWIVGQGEREQAGARILMNWSRHRQKYVKKRRWCSGGIHLDTGSVASPESGNTEAMMDGSDCGC
jgi:urocanate hydratase